MPGPPLLLALLAVVAAACPPCDTDMGLHCDPDTRTCIGKLLVRTSDVGHTWAAIRWMSPRRADVPQASVKYAPADQPSLWTSVQEVNESTARLSNLRPGSTYLVRVEEDGLFEVATLKTLDTPPRVLVMDKSPSKVTLAWDDFRTDRKDYVLTYRSTVSNDSDWTRVTVGAVPMYGLDGLKPNSTYEVRVSLGNLSTPQLSVTTEDGCVHAGTVYLVGQTGEQGCQLRCVCLGGNRLECRERCSGDTCRSDPCCALTPCGAPPRALPPAVPLPNISTTPRKLETSKGVQLGCVFKEATYRPGEQFEDGCEARCACDGQGRVSCVSRCPARDRDSLGPTCRTAADPDDPCCQLELCSPLGDQLRGPSGGGGLAIVSAGALGATAAQMRVRAPAAQGLTILIAPVAGALSWNSWPVARLAQLGPSLFQMDIKDLQPMESYYVRVRSPTGVSNTVSIKTFPVPASTPSAGSQCLHHNRTYSEGETLDDGCQLRCVCRAGGLLECRERCPPPPALVPAHCQWEPAPDDPCCAIPRCNATLPTCETEDGEAKLVGDSWQRGHDCTQQLCACSLTPTGEAVVRCKGRCPTIPAAASIPTPECPRPVLKTPPDPCLCPYMVCDNSANPLSAPVPRCHYKGRQYDIGKEFHDGCQSLCHCGQDLRVACAPIECPHSFPPRLSECLEWVTEPDFHPSPPHCCPQVTCKNDGSCLHQGLRIANFQEVSRDLLPCGTRCVCVNGNLTCDDRCGAPGDRPPSTLPCAEDRAYLGLPPGENCCRKWLCREPGHELNQIEVVPSGPSAVAVSLTLPAGLSPAQIEVAYSRDPTTPRGSWARQTFPPTRTAPGQYVVAGLAPDTVYYLQVRATGERRRPAESDVYKVRTTAATTTLPPVLELDMELREGVAEPREAEVRWRPLTAQERRLLDGFRVRHRPTDGTGEWTVGGLLHRDATFYRLRGLLPDCHYRVELMLQAREDVATELVSARGLDIFTPPAPPDMYDFHVAVKAGSGHLTLLGMPEPASKYVHVARITAAGRHDTVTVFQPVKSSTSLRLPTELTPGQRYRVSVLLYLTNGKTLSSNEVDVLMPPGNRTSKSVSGAGDGGALPLADPASTYFLALVITASLAGAATLALIFVLSLWLKERRAKPSRPPSHSSYDNPSFKSNDDSNKPSEHPKPAL